MSEVLRRRIKRGLDVCSLVVVAPAIAICAIERRLTPDNEDLFLTFAQAFALLPGLPGVFLRRAFYRHTLESCSGNFFVGFGAFFSQRRVTIEADVYIGPYAIVGMSKLRRGCLIGSRVSIMSGKNPHPQDENGRWLPTDRARLEQVEIGEYAWLGEGAMVMADVGPSAMIAAGAVVTNRVPAFVMVAGNPARFVRSLRVVAPEADESVTVRA